MCFAVLDCLFALEIEGLKRQKEKNEQWPRADSGTALAALVNFGGERGKSEKHSRRKILGMRRAERMCQEGKTSLAKMTI